jgi:hypothetical protein
MRAQMASEVQAQMAAQVAAMQAALKAQMEAQMAAQMAAQQAMMQELQELRSSNLPPGFTSNGTSEQRSAAAQPAFSPHHHHLSPGLCAGRLPRASPSAVCSSLALIPHSQHKHKHKIKTPALSLPCPVLAAPHAPLAPRASSSARL